MKSETYLEKILKLRKNDTVKVITGVRGVGKTTLLAMLERTLKAEDVPSWQIIAMDFDAMQNDEIRDFHQLYDSVYERIQGVPHAYLLLDEVHRVEGWEKAVNAFFVGAPVDVYVTGSHAGILSEDFTKLMVGRYEEFRMFPQTFRTYLEACPDAVEEDRDFIFPRYLKFGGLPVSVALAEKQELLPVMLQGIYNTALMRDVVQRYAVRDPALMDSMARFLAGTVGKPVSAKRLNDYLVSVGRKTTGYTMDNYLQMLTESNLFCRARRYDIRGKAHLNGSEKFYMADIGLSNMLRGYQDLEDGPLLENVVYLELRRRGFSVSVGKLGSMEVDFVAVNAEGRRIYYQVEPSLQDAGVRKKALRPLKSIPDQYEKVILSMDRSDVRDFDGIRNLNIVDFLMGE